MNITTQIVAELTELKLQDKKNLNKVHSGAKNSIFKKRIT